MDALPSVPADLVELVIFDADDTLWKSEDYYQEMATTYLDVVKPFATEGADPHEVLQRFDIGNVERTGYGTIAHTLSMLEAAIDATGGSIPSAELSKIIEEGYRVATHPVEVLDGVVEVLEAIGDTHPLAVITKGELLQQRRKLETSGLAGHFSKSRVVREKDVDTYASVFDDWGVHPESVLMVGNSMKSDVAPIIELGGYAVYIPYHLTWAHEIIDDVDGHHGELTSIRDLPRWFSSPLGSFERLASPQVDNDANPAVS